MKGVRLGLIHTMTRAKRINPPSLEEVRGWWGFKLRQALQWVERSQRQTTGSLCSTKIQRTVTETWSLFFVQPPSCKKKARTLKSSNSTQIAEQKKTKHVQEDGESTTLIFYRGRRKKSEDKPEDTTDCVTMETRTWKRTQGPLKVDDLPWLHPWQVPVPLRTVVRGT